ncbi:13514_t:CDS:2, partial [Cetraspora pellucida]
TINPPTQKNRSKATTQKPPLPLPPKTQPLSLRLTSREFGKYTTYRLNKQGSNYLLRETNRAYQEELTSQSPLIHHGDASQLRKQYVDNNPFTATRKYYYRAISA